MKSLRHQVTERAEVWGSATRGGWAAAERLQFGAYFLSSDS
jgi:hypothetical protein